MEKASKTLLDLYKQAPKMMGVGGNHQSDKSIHKAIRDEGEPRLFLKPVQGIIQNPKVVVNESLQKVVCEIELAAVIGKSCRNVSEEDSLDYIQGYFLSSDLTCFRWKPISLFADTFYLKFWEDLRPVSNFIDASVL